MRLQGKLYKANLLMADIVVESQNKHDSFVKELEECFLGLCKEMEIPIPLWLDKNTKEFARFRQTIFFAEHFTDKVNFDRFQIKLLK